MRSGTRRAGALLAMLMLVLARAAASSTATVTITGTEQQIGGVWDTSELTISFNSFSETVGYGQFSTATSIASALGAMFSRDYAAYGLCAHASGSTITFTLKSGSFGPISASGPTTSFSASSSGGQGSEPPPPPPPPPNGSCQASLHLERSLPQQLLKELSLHIGPAGHLRMEGAPELFHTASDRQIAIFRAYGNERTGSKAGSVPLVEAPQKGRG